MKYSHSPGGAAPSSQSQWLSASRLPWKGRFEGLPRIHRLSASTLDRAVCVRGDGDGGAITRGLGEVEKKVLLAESGKQSAIHRACRIIVTSPCHCLVSPEQNGWLRPVLLI